VIAGALEVDTVITKSSVAVLPELFFAVIVTG